MSTATDQRGLRILFVCGGDLSAPSEKQVLWFARQLASNGHAVMLSLYGDPSTATGEGVEATAGLDLHWHRFRAGRIRRADTRAALRFAPDLLHAWNSRPPVEVPARAYARATGAPVMVHWEDDEWGQLDGLPAHSTDERVRHLVRRALHRVHPPHWNLSTRRSLAWALEEGAAFDAVTPELAREVRQRTGRDCAVILPASAPEAWLAGENETVELPAAVASRDVLLYTGDVNFGRAPDVKLGIEATGLLQRRGNRVAFVHAGRNTARADLLEMAAHAGLERDTLVELGNLPYSQIPQLLRRASILLQPGRPTNFNRFGLPSKLQSYLASGTPCITFAIGAGELLEDRVEVLKTYTGDPRELANRIEELLTDSELQSNLSRNGPLAAWRLFDPARNTDALLQHYRSVLNTGP